MSLPDKPKAQISIGKRRGQLEPIGEENTLPVSSDKDIQVRRGGMEEAGESPMYRGRGGYVEDSLCEPLSAGIRSKGKSRL